MYTFIFSYSWKTRSFVFMSLSLVFSLLCFVLFSYCFVFLFSFLLVFVFVNKNGRNFLFSKPMTLRFLFCSKTKINTSRKRAHRTHSHTHTKLLHLLFKMLWKVKLQKKRKRNEIRPHVHFRSFVRSHHHRPTSIFLLVVVVHPWMNITHGDFPNLMRIDFRLSFFPFSFSWKFSFFFLQTFCQITKCDFFFLRIHLSASSNACFIEMLFNGYNAHTLELCEFTIPFSFNNNKILPFSFESAPLVISYIDILSIFESFCTTSLAQTCTHSHTHTSGRSHHLSLAAFFSLSTHCKSSRDTNRNINVEFQRIKYGNLNFDDDKMRSFVWSMAMAVAVVSAKG